MIQAHVLRTQEDEQAIMKEYLSAVFCKSVWLQWFNGSNGLMCGNDLFHTIIISSSIANSK